MIAWLRDAAWLGGERARLYAAAAGLLCAAMAFGFLRAVTGFGGGLAGDIDFIAFYAAAKVALAGDPALAWDPAAHAAARAAVLGPEVRVYPFLHPPPFLLLVLPLGLLPYWPALLAWIGATLAGFLLALRGWGAGRAALAAALLSPAAVLNAAHGQAGFLMAGALAAAGLFLVRRPWAAGLALALLALKPQLGLLVLPALLAARRWGAICWGGAFVAVFAAASLAAFGWEAWRAFLDLGLRYQEVVREGALEAWKLQSVAAFATTVLRFGGTGALVLQLAVALAVVAAVAAALRHRPGGMAEAAAIGAGLPLVTPYILSYDLVVQLVPMAWILVRARQGGFLPWEKVLLPLVAAMPAVWLVTGLWGGLSLTAPASALLFLLVLQRLRAGG